MSILSISDASRMAGVSTETLTRQIENGEIRQTPDGIQISELILAYPELKPLANVKIRAVKKRESRQAPTADASNEAVIPAEFLPLNDEKSSDSASVAPSIQPDIDVASSEPSALSIAEDSQTVSLLIRELEWNKELLEQTNQLMAKQLAEQRALISDQARRLDEKDRFWARQIEIAQSLLPAPEAPKRKRFLGIF